jgi:23S rRNA pseudouridine2605 synthase
MRINKFVAQSSGLSRRAADQAIAEGRVTIDNRAAVPGDDVTDHVTVQLDGKTLSLPTETLTIMLNKPVGYVSSRRGQGSRTIYDLLPPEYHDLKPVGRLDKDSSGLLLLTNDGNLANQLTHPRYVKTKIYEIELDKPLGDSDKMRIITGVQLDDGPSKFHLANLDKAGQGWQASMTEGRNRQIRRTFAALGYSVTKLHRINFGNYELGQLSPGEWSQLTI